MLFQKYCKQVVMLDFLSLTYFFCFLYCLWPESSKRPQPLVKGLVLLNCSGGMNNKAIVDDWRIKLLLPLLWLIDFLLKQKAIASAIFERAKQRYNSLDQLLRICNCKCQQLISFLCRENLRNVLLSVYGSKESVDDTLVEVWLYFISCL